MTALLDTWRARLDAFPQSVLQLLMRFSIFWVFWRSGTLKFCHVLAAHCAQEDCPGVGV